MIRRTAVIGALAAALLAVAPTAVAAPLDDADLGDPPPLVVEDVPDGWLNDDGVWVPTLTDEELAAIPENVEPEEPTSEPTATEEPEPCVTEADGWSPCDDGSTWAPDAPDGATGSIG